MHSFRYCLRHIGRYQTDLAYMAEFPSGGLFGSNCGRFGLRGSDTVR
jgi:hypothetical protein